MLAITVFNIFTALAPWRIHSKSRNACDCVVCMYVCLSTPTTPKWRGMETSSRRGSSLNSLNKNWHVFFLFLAKKYEFVFDNHATSLGQNQNSQKKYAGHFHWLGPLGRVSHRVRCPCVCMCVIKVVFVYFGPTVRDFLFFHKTL